MFCTNCGTKLDDDLKFCTNCGTRLQKSEENPVQPAQNVQQNPVPKNSTVISNQNFQIPSDKKALKKAVFSAVMKNDVAVVEACLNAGYKVDKRLSAMSQTDSITPIGFAAIFNSTDVAKLLIQRGAHIKGMAANCGGWNHNPLMLAVINNSLETAKLLLDAGADPNATNANGRTSLKIAEIRCYPEMQDLLLKYGAKSNSVRSVMMKGALAASVFTGNIGLAFQSGTASADVDDIFLRAHWEDDVDYGDDDSE